MNCEMCGQEFTPDGHQGVVHHTVHCASPYCIEACEECQQDAKVVGGTTVKPRLIYENGANEEDEKRIIAAFCDANNAHASKTPKFSAYDFEVYHDATGELWACVEVKRRNVKKDAYRDIFLSKAKVDKAVSEARTKGCAFVFLVGFDDAVSYCKVFDPVSGFIRCNTATGGRTDRGDLMDIETVYVIPAKWFTPISKGEG